MQFRFGDHQLDVARRELRRGAELVTLEPQVFDLLVYLVRNRDRVVTKDDLLDAVWSGRVVSELTLTSRINAARKAIGDSGEAQRLIRTSPRKGIRFVGEVSELPPAEPTLPPTPQARPSLAVLPFQNMSGDVEQDYFADGVVEDIITALSRFRSFAVIARNSSFIYKGRAVDVRQVAKDLGVRYVLEGSVRRAGERLRITAQLADGASGSHLWARAFDGMVADVFDLQDRITEGVVTVVAPQIREAEIERSRGKRAENLDAYELYLRGIAKIRMTRAAENAEAYAYLTRAIALEPDNALFLAGAAYALRARAAVNWPPLTPDDGATALELVRRALSDVRGDADILANCAYTLMVFSREYDRGMQIVSRSIEANPNSPTVLIYAAVSALFCGSLQDALTYGQRAVQADPLMAHFSITVIAHAHMALGNYDEALKAAERSLAVNANYYPTHWMLIAANAQLGRMDEARRLLARLRELAPGATIAGIRAGRPDKDPSRMAAILEGLRLAGLPES